MKNISVSIPANAQKIRNISVFIIDLCKDFPGSGYKIFNLNENEMFSIVPNTTMFVYREHKVAAQQCLEKELMLCVGGRVEHIENL